MKQPNGVNDIRNRFALQDTPTQFSEVTVPNGTSVRISATAKNDRGKGGGVQAELVGASDPRWFSNLKPLK